MKRFSFTVRPIFYPAVAWIVIGSTLIGVGVPQGAAASASSAPPATRPAAPPVALVTRPAVVRIPAGWHPAVPPIVLAAAKVAPTPAPKPAAPTPTTPTTPTKPAVHPSTVPAAQPGQEAWLSIPSIGLNLPVFFGGQAVIDRGVVTHYTGPGWRPPVAAGQPGTYWLAGHHYTHGGPFLNLLAVRPGDIVTITPTNGGPAIRYVITSLQIVGTTASYATVYGTDTTTPRLLLQTCEGAAYRLLVHGVKI